MDKTKKKIHEKRPLDRSGPKSVKFIIIGLFSILESCVNSFCAITKYVQITSNTKKLKFWKSFLAGKFNCTEKNISGSEMAVNGFYPKNNFPQFFSPKNAPWWQS